MSREKFCMIEGFPGRQGNPPRPEPESAMMRRYTSDDHNMRGREWQ
jgi:hypothetical protein